MIHTFLSNEIVKVGDISYISKIIKDDNYTAREDQYSYEILLNNNTKIKQVLRYKISRSYRYCSELNRQEEIEYDFGDCRLKGKEFIDLKVNRLGEYKLPLFDENIDCFKGFMDNYRDLINKFKEVNE